MAASITEIQRIMREEAQRLLAQPIGVVEVETPSKPIHYNKTMVEADTEYEIPIPVGTKKFSIRLRSTSHAWLNSWQSNEVAGQQNAYTTVPASGEYYEEGIKTEAGLKLYVACATAGQVLEAIFWR